MADLTRRDFTKLALARHIEMWALDRLKPFDRNPRTHSDEQVAQIAASILEFGFTNPVLVSHGEILAGHGRLLAARKLGLPEVPVVVLDHLTETQRRAYIIADNKLAENAGWDEEMLRGLMTELRDENFDLGVIGFADKELDDLFFTEDAGRADEVPPVPAIPVSQPSDLWICGRHRVLCGDCTSADDVARLLEDRKPILMVTDPPYGIELDSEWRDRAGLNGNMPPGGMGGKRTQASKDAAKQRLRNPAEPSYMKHRTPGHTETTISGDTRADWSDAFALVPSLQVAYVWHASAFTREVLDGLLRIGFVHHQQLIWDKGRTVLTRTHYWFQHEPCWYVRKKNAPWFGTPGDNSTIWAARSPKFIMGGSDEEKFDHPTQKPVELMRKPIVNHLHRGELVYEPFLGSGTTLAAAELTERACCGMEIDPKYVDVIVQRWQGLAEGQTAKLEATGQTFEEVRAERVPVAVSA